VICAPVAIVVILASFAWAPLRKQVLEREPKPLRETMAYRWSRVIQHHPWASVFAGLGIILILAIPVISLRLGFSDEGNDPKETTTRKAYDLLAEGFGPGFNGPLIITAAVPPGTPKAKLDAVTDAVKQDSGIQFVSPAVVNNEANATAVLW